MATAPAKMKHKPAVERDCAKARSPSLLRWAAMEAKMRSSIIVLVVLLCPFSVAAEEARNQYVSEGLGISIVVPVSAKPQSGNYQVAAFFLPWESGFSGNVNIQRQSYTDSIESYQRLSTSQFKQAGFTVIRQVMSGNEFKIEYSGQLQGMTLHWYARAISKPPYVYLVTATALESSWTTQKQSLIRSVDSFSAK